mmetsp:Transcript_348/g.407  ORF Transcript_348/g.407 Transcript_348/m.407 type:complete len:363 (+) Transcript_348:88-1176(+)
MEVSLERLKSVPKLELHAHLHGSISLEMLSNLLRERETQTQLSSKAANESVLRKRIDALLSRTLNSNKSVHQNLDDCFEIFDIIHSIVVDTATLKVLLKQVILEFAQDNVVYLEIRTTPRRTDYMTERDYMDAVVSTIQECEAENLPIIVRVLVSVNRSRGLAAARLNVDLACEYHKKTNVVVGVDFSGNPNQGSFAEYVQVLNKARKNGLKISVHCAETEDRKEVELILREFKPDRVGHMLFVPKDLLGEMLRQQNPTPIECCPTSNCITLGLENISYHPNLRFWIDNDYPICVCTDDSGVFNTSLTEEIYKIASAFNLSWQQILGIIQTPTQSTFATENDKIKLKALIQAKIGTKTFSSM